MSLAAIDVLLCDVDGNLFPSEEPAFVASAAVTNRFLESLGVARRFTAEELRLATTGKNFRTTAAELAAAFGARIAPAELERWVAEEKRQVTAYLAVELTPDPEVSAPLDRLGERYVMAAVSSSADARITACLEATGLAQRFPPERRFSAEDSLAHPRSKPDPAIYVHAARALGVEPAQGLAIEDSVPGVESAVVAGFATVGNLQFVPVRERAPRAEQLRAAGVVAVVTSWHAVEQLLDPRTVSLPA